MTFGFESRKTNENAAASPTQRHMRPKPSRINALTGVRFPNALARKNLGNVSCSIAR